MKVNSENGNRFPGILDGNLHENDLMTGQKAVPETDQFCFGCSVSVIRQALFAYVEDRSISRGTVQ